MDSLLYIGIVHSLFIALFLLSKPQKNTRDIILIYWMIFLGLPMASDLSSPQGFDLPIPLLRDKLPYAFTFGPLLLLYTDHITGRTRWCKSQYILHFAPFVVASIYKLLFVQELSFNPNLDAENSILGNLLSAAILISTLGYSLATLDRLEQHKVEVLNQFSSLSTAISLKWIKWLAITFIASSALPFVAILCSLPELFHTRIFALLAFMFVLSFFGLKQLQIFYETEIRDEHGDKEKAPNPELETVTTGRSHDESDTASESDQLSKVANEAQQKERYERSGLTDERAQVLLTQLEAHMKEDKPYLDSNLTADKLAQQLATPRHHLTQIFSEQLNKNFYLFINEYRVRAVEELIQDPAQQSQTLLDMAYQCGFNSKSTFNKFFKTITGMTPSQYRKTKTEKP